MFEDDRFFATIDKIRPIKPEELVEIVAGERNPMLGGLHSSFFITSRHEERLQEQTDETLIRTFLDGLHSPYREKLNKSAIPDLLQNPMDRDEAYAKMTQLFMQGVALEGGRFGGNKERSRLIAKKIMICYPGLRKVFTTEGLTNGLFPVGLKAEVSFVLLFKKACALTTFLGWD